MIEKELTDFLILETQLLEHLTHRIQESIRAQGEARIALAGGNTPKNLYRRLAQESIDWSKVVVTLTDERVVPDTHPDSNSGMLKECFLNHCDARFIPWTKTFASATEMAAEVTKNVIPQLPFDVVLLGMGDDGHTASLFPDAPIYTEAMDPNSAPECVVVDTTWVKYQRLSLNFAALQQTRLSLILWKGKDKLPLYQRAKNGDTALPITPFLSSSLASCTPTEVWFSL